MPFIEQLLFGVNIKEDKKSRSVLAHSPGMGQDATAEIVRLIENWGSPPPLGLENPTVMSFPLVATMPSVAGKLVTVIQAGKGLNPLFHAVVLSDGAYASFLRNPFAVSRVVNFWDEFHSDRKLGREEINFDATVPLVDPPANEKDLGLVDEAVLKLIADGKLMMPIEQTHAQSDRCLALIIACMPEKNRKDLRFASFAPSESNNYILAATESEGCVFAGWQRMMMAWLAGEYVEDVENYISEIRNYLKAGDMAGISRTSQRHMVKPSVGPDTRDMNRRETISAAMPVQGPKSPRASKAFRAVPSKPALTPSEPVRPAGRPLGARTSMTPVPGPGSAPVRSQKPQPRRLRKTSPLKRKLQGTITATGSPGFSRVRVIRFAVGVLLLALAGMAGMMWKEGKTLAESLEWANLQGILGEETRSERAATLLEVVDVGGVYADQLKLVSGAGKGLNPSVDRGRRQALGKLREEAAAPLIQQVELFAKLASDGIQQGSRPDRESRRMRSLADQGLVLDNELARLDLSWYSLAASVFWQDLATLPDKNVIARRDSLARAVKGALQDARRDMGTGEAKMVLDQTRGNVDGMASLLALFETESWSSGWEKSLNRAAGQVSTTASRMTRAYANSAFALLSLKRAEKKELQTSLPYLRELKDRDWPSAEVRGLLINLRAQTVMFADGQAPSLLTETLDLYSSLKNPASLAGQAAGSPRVLDNLNANRAVRFHSAAYSDFLERIRFEAAVLSLDGSEDSAMIPGHLYADSDRDMVVGFRDTMSVYHFPAAWDSLAASTDSPFLTRWAGHLGDQARIDQTRARQDFDVAWLECRTTGVQLQDEAAAGRNWTVTWLSLNEQTRTLSASYARALAQDPERSAKLADVTNLALALHNPLPLGLESGTIRLDQDRLLEATGAVLEIRVTPDGEVLQSRKFHIGPAAPEGAGWVGTVRLEKSLEILPRQGLEVRLISENKDEILLAVTCPPLAEGTGPGGMLRPRSGGRGSVSLKIEASYWKSLRIPGLGMIF